MEGKFRKSIGAWIKESKSGRKYISFKLDDGYYAMFKNDKKTKDEHPDYNILPPDKQENEINTDDIF